MSLPPASPRPAFRRARQGSPDDGREVFRLTAPVVIWWIWLAFAVANVVDLGLQAQPWFAARVSVVLLTITGVAYACGFRPRVVADEAGLSVVNPVRQWRVPWAAIRGIEVRDWVRIQCVRTPGGDATKTIECWALFATARVKRNYSRRAQDQITRSANTARIPDEAKRLMSLPVVVIIARQLERRAGQAQAHGATDERVITSWAWPSIAAMLLPAIALVIILLT
ncbi:MAG: PH domain-containing protein [Streptosporangiaceae bacterium]